MLDCNTYTLKAFKALTNAYACFSNMSYFNLASQRDLLKKAMGCSCPSSFFWSSTTTIVSSKAKEKIKSSLA
jgi:hypothetical protein